MMSSELRAYLDGPELSCDHWLYRLQEVIGFKHPACGLIEELRGLCKHFQSAMPTTLPQPRNASQGVLRKSIGKIRWEVARAWDRGELTPDDKASARKLHTCANEVLRLLGIDARPPGAYSAAILNPTDWCFYLSNLSQSRDAIDRVQADLGLLADAGIVISEQPEPAPNNIIYCIRRMMADASAAFGGSHNYLIQRFHHDCKALRAALEDEGLIPKERVA